jgi:hypothetical protein
MVVQGFLWRAIFDNFQNVRAGGFERLLWQRERSHNLDVKTSLVSSLRNNFGFAQPLYTSQWILAPMGAAFCLQGVYSLVRLYDIPLGIVQLVIGLIALIAVAQKEPLAGHIRVVIFGFFAAAGMAEIVLGRWIVGLTVLILTVLAVAGINQERHQADQEPALH